MGVQLLVRNEAIVKAYQSGGYTKRLAVIL